MARKTEKKRNVYEREIKRIRKWSQNEKLNCYNFVIIRSQEKTKHFNIIY